MWENYPHYRLLRSLAWCDAVKQQSGGLQDQGEEEEELEELESTP